MNPETTHPVISHNQADAGTPGVQVEHTAAQAEHEGAFRENAISEKDAWESNIANDPNTTGIIVNGKAVSATAKE